MQPTLIRLQISYNNTLQQLYKDSIIICLYICTCAFVCGYSAKANKFALHIAHFANFVLKICINLGKNSLICCKRLKIQRFLVFCLVDSKYLCTFASQLRTKRNNKHNENNQKQEAARHITGHRNTEQGTVKTRLTFSAIWLTVYISLTTQKERDAHGEDNYPCGGGSG